MSLLERRLQLLLDEDRYRRVKRAADSAGRSVSAMIRDSIDTCYPDADRAREQAAADFLALRRPTEPEPDFAESVDAMGEQLISRLP